MIKLENLNVVGWEPAIRGMRNPMNSWNKSDSKTINQTLQTEEVCPGIERTYWVGCEPYTSIGPNDHELMMKLRNAGTDDRKFMRMLIVYVDITAPLYWWKEFDTYKVGTVANSCSTMHKIHDKEFTLDDFSCEHLINITKPTVELIEKDCVPMDVGYGDTLYCTALNVLEVTIDALNKYRQRYLETKDKNYWWQMIQLLPSSYNQRRTVMLNYEVLANMYKSRKTHKLDEWRVFCKRIEQLPYSEIITGEREAE